MFYLDIGVIVFTPVVWLGLVLIASKGFNKSANSKKEE
jgi:hypothetical protein